MDAPPYCIDSLHHRNDVMGTGHYFAYVKNPTREYWLLMNDEEVLQQPPNFHPCSDVELNVRKPTVAAVLLLYEPAEREEDELRSGVHDRLI